MKRPIRFFLGLAALAVALTSCGESSPPEMLAYEGPYEYAEVLVTVIVPGHDFIEYVISCREDSAKIEGTKKLNANDVCLAASGAVQDRLQNGRDDTQLCSHTDPQEGDPQFLGTVGGARINTFIDRSDQCGQEDWDELLTYVALSPAEVAAS
ncbi:MAG: hypothetical protein R2706_02380 [Acidimicrobiales bacterium]